MHKFVAIPDPSLPDETPSDQRSSAAEQSSAIKTWARQILKLDDEAVITVAEFACSDPGCPLLETVITVFEAGGTRRWKLTRPRMAVTKLMVHQTLQAPPHITQ